MVTSEFMRTLVEEEIRILSTLEFRDTSGNTCNIHAYEQSLPEIEGDDDDPSVVFPYVIVRIGEGTTEDFADPWHIPVTFLFGVYDHDKSANGHRHVMNMIERTTQRYLENSAVKCYRAEDKMSFALQEEETYPFYFGGLEMSFIVPKLERRNFVG